QLRRRTHADQRLAQVGAVAGIVQRLAGDADDAAAGRDLAVEETVEQRRQQLAQGKVAGAAEDHQVERFDRLGGSSHAITSTRCRMAGGGRMARSPGFSSMVPVKYQIDHGSAYEFMPGPDPAGG